MRDEEHDLEINMLRTALSPHSHLIQCTYLTTVLNITCEILRLMHVLIVLRGIHVGAAAGLLWRKPTCRITETERTPINASSLERRD